MQKGQLLSFPCTQCGSKISFDLQNVQKVACTECNKSFVFDDVTLLSDIESFANLLQAIKGAERILSSATIGVRVGDKEVQVPYKLLLTRLTSSLALDVDGQKLNLTFRSEPFKS